MNLDIKCPHCGEESDGVFPENMLKGKKNPVVVTVCPVCSTPIMLSDGEWSVMGPEQIQKLGGHGIKQALEALKQVKAVMQSKQGLPKDEHAAWLGKFFMNETLTTHPDSIVLLKGEENEFISGAPFDQVEDFSRAMVELTSRDYPIG